MMTMRTSETVTTTSTPSRPLESLSLPKGLRLPVDLCAEAAEDIEDQSDDDEIDADVEQRRRDELDVADPGELEFDEGALQRREPEQERRHGARDRDRHADAEEAAGVGRRSGAEFVAPAGDVAHDERHARDEAAREPPAGQVVAGEEHVERHDDDRVEEDPHDHLEDDRAVLRPDPLAAHEPRPRAVAEVGGLRPHAVLRLDERGAASASRRAAGEPSSPRACPSGG